jgi:hypothetical protein
MKIFAEITLAVEFLDHAQVAGIVNKIVYDFDDKWMRIFFHEPDLLLHCLLYFLVKKV